MYGKKLFSQSAYGPILVFTLRARWILIGLLSLGVVFAPSLAVRLPYVPLTGVLLFLTVLNGMFSMLHYRVHMNRGLIELGLLTDVLALSALLYMTGGSSNPFSALYLPPVLIAALVCSPYFSRILTGVVVAVFLMLSFFFRPLTLGAGHPLWLHTVNAGGIWFTFTLSVVLIVLCTGWMVRALDRRENQLARAHAQQLKNEGLLSLGIEAAHIAHKLSTPLNSLLLLNDELSSAPNLPEPVRQDLQLMHNQLIQCRDVLWQLKPDGRRSDDSDIMLYETLATRLEHWHNLRPDVHYRWQQHTPINPDISVHLDALFWSAFLNILNNAADAGQQEILLETAIEGGIFVAGIRNRQGFLSEGQLLSAGWDAQQSEKPAGLGLGVLLSHATLERLGGSLSLQNHSGGGVYAEIRLPLQFSEAKYDASDGTVKNRTVTI